MIVGLTPRGHEPAEKRLFSYVDAKGEPTETNPPALNAYLLDAKASDRHLVVKEESRPINNAPRLKTGVQMIDNGIYTFDNIDRARFLEEEPASEPLFRSFIGGDEYINGFHLWILYFADATPAQLRQLPHVRSRVAAVRDYRSSSSRPSTMKMADDPTRLGVDERLSSNYLVIPNTSSERREYVQSDGLVRT